jgi:DNA-directed RNA polymerase subunit RPC12/RpoP
MMRPMTKPLRAGGEVDSWCTKCKLLLNHRIIAMVGTQPRKVECSTCGSHHLFRARPPGEKAPSAGTRSSGGSASASGPRSVRGPTKAQQAILDRERTWEKAIAGKGVNEFRAYRVTEVFNEGDLVRHSKFGDGVVTRIIEGKKVEILFKDEPRTLAQGLTD